MTSLTKVWRQLLWLWMAALLIATPSLITACGSDTTEVPVPATGGSAGGGGKAGSGGSVADAQPDKVTPTDAQPDKVDPSKKVATPQFSIPGGTYQGAQSVQITTSTAGAKIYYTVDGNDPTDASPVYSSPVQLAEGTKTTVKAFATATGYADSAISAATYTIEKGEKQQAVAPTFAPPGGTYSTAQNVSITSSTAGVVIHYTVDGNDPNAGSPTYSAPIAVSTTTTIKAIAIHPQGTFLDSPVSTATYTFPTKVATPVFNIPSGTYVDPQTVQINCATPNSQIYYTTDGTDPTSASTQYTMPISVSATTTLKAIGVATGYLDSSIATAVYTITPKDPPAAAPTFAPPGGTYTSAQNVTITSATAGAEIRYTMDGTDPTASSTLYAGPVAINNSTILKAFATATGFSPSPIATAIYNVTITQQAVPPTITPNGGSFAAPVQVTLATTQPSGVIIYTTNGTLPTVGNGTVYSGPFTISQTATVNAITTAAGFEASNPATATFTITIPVQQVLPVTINPGSTSSTNDIDVALTTATSGATICYTTDGSIPTCAADGSCQTGQTYGGVPVAINKTNTVLTARGCKAGMDPSATSNATYTLNTAPVAFNPAPGSLAYATAITMSTTTAGATIRYRTDGIDPTCSTGTPYAGLGVPVTQNTEFRAVACKANYGPTPASVQSATYTVRLLQLVPTRPTSTVNNAVADARFSVIYPAAFLTPAMKLCYTIDGAAPTCTAAGDCDATSLTQAWGADDPVLGHVTQPIAPAVDAPVGGNSTRTIRAITCGPNYEASPLTTVIYTYKAGTPTFERASGTTTLTNENAHNDITFVTVGSTMRWYDVVPPAAAPTLNCAVPPLPAGVTEVAVSPQNAPASGSHTIGAISCKTDYQPSDIATANYPLPGQTVAPVFTLAGNPMPATFNNDLAQFAVRMTTTSIPNAGEVGAAGVVCWTLADTGNVDCIESATAPTCVAPAPGGTYTWTAATSLSNVPPTAVDSNGKQLRAIACGNGMQKSAVTTQVLKFQVGAPVITAPAPGTTIGIGEELKFSSVTQNVPAGSLVFRYTVGTVTAPPADPNCTSVGTVGNSYTVTNGDRVNGSLIVKVIGCKTGYDPSTVTTSLTYTAFRGGAAVFSIKAGTFNDVFDDFSTNTPSGPIYVNAGGAGVLPDRICVTVDGFTPQCGASTCTGGTSHYVNGSAGIPTGSAIPWSSINAANNFTLRALPCYNSGLGLTPPDVTVEGPYNLEIAPLTWTNVTPTPNPTPYAKTQKLEYRIGTDASAGPPVVNPVYAPGNTTVDGWSMLCYTSDGSALGTGCTSTGSMYCIPVSDGAGAAKLRNLYTDSTWTINAKICKSIMTPRTSSNTVTITPWTWQLAWNGSDEFITRQTQVSWGCSNGSHNPNCDNNAFRTSWDDTYLYLSEQGCGVLSHTYNNGNYFHVYIGSPTLNGTSFQQPSVTETGAPAQMTVFPATATVNEAVLGGARYHLLYNVETHAAELRQYNFSNGNWNDVVPSSGVQVEWGVGEGTWGNCTGAGNYGDWVIARIPWTTLSGMRYFSLAGGVYRPASGDNFSAWPASDVGPTYWAYNNTARSWYLDRASWRSPRGFNGGDGANPVCWRNGVDNSPTCQIPESCFWIDAGGGSIPYDTTPRKSTWTNVAPVTPFLYFLGPVLP